jgi:AmmeMemoRadiSam system protein B
MLAPKDAPVRQPAVAGIFYPGGAMQCLDAARQFVALAGSGARVGSSEVESSQLNSRGSKSRDDDLDGGRPNGSSDGAASWIGAIVPHAGWICSGAIAGEAIGTLAAGRPGAEVVVVFGAIHLPGAGEVGLLDTYGSWAFPGGSVRVATELRRALSGEARRFAVNDHFHGREHAVEVELPLIAAAWPRAALVAIQTPLHSSAPEIGRAAAAAVRAAGMSAVYVASSDLTHYGPAYRFHPAGIGAAGLNWARGNDERLLRVVAEMTPEGVVPEVRAHLNACGGGAIAAMLAASMEAGAARARVLRHASSFQTLAAVAPQTAENAVGYAGVVVG